MIDDPRRRRDILVAVCIALMAVIAAVSGLNVAQPPLARDLDASQTEVLWIINIYAITLAALLLPLGAVGDRWGRKPVLLAGLAVFGLANALAGLAPNAQVMLGARLLSGVGAAMIMPVTLSVITSAFPAEERSKGIGIWTAIAGGGGILGMFLSALLVDLLDWRWLFVLPIVLVIVAALMALRAVPNSRDTSSYGFDFVGAALSLLSIVGLIFFLHEGPSQGWTALATLAALTVGLLAGIAFAAWELRHPAPLLDVRFFGRRNLTSGSVTLMTWFGVQAGVFIVLYPFFQAVLGWSGLMATLGLMPMALLMMVSSALAPRLATIAGPRLTMACGIALGGLGLVLMALLVSVEGGYPAILPGMIAMGLGMGLSMTPSTEAITSSLPREQQGVASALNDVTREFGTALGVALLGTVFAAGYANAVATRLAELPSDISEAAARGIATALDIAGRQGPDGARLVQSSREAFVDAWQQSMLAGVVVMAILLAYILVRGPVGSGRADPA
ncbi:multidrug MFS transporter [Devosia riboflavina]|uniref:Multidrug MFS transporter n=1 Tax=Devosia riboflavina TaxID=46914 RepID=A0A087M4Q3_9HYPH|nr:multidrug MFS transporter [Devosia riboflavina]